MKNLKALKALLETEPLYGPALEEGSNSTLLELLNADAGDGQTVPTVAGRDQVLAEIDLKGLAGDDLLRLRILLDPGQVDFRVPEIAAQLQELCGKQVACGVRPRTRIEAAGWTEPVTADDLPGVLQQIPNSQLARYLAGEFGPPQPAEHYLERVARQEKEGKLGAGTLEYAIRVASPEELAKVNANELKATAAQRES